MFIIVNTNGICLDFSLKNIIKKFSTHSTNPNPPCTMVLPKLKEDFSMNLPKHITNEQTGIHYTLHGDYYLPDLKLPEPKDNRPIGKWGQLHLNHLKKHCKSTYYTYLMNGTLHDYLCSINDQAEDMFNRIVSHMAETDGTDEKLKATDQMKWVGLMNNYRHCAEEIVFDSIIYT